MGFVHPEDLQVGDIIQFMSKKSWIRKECNWDKVSGLNIGEIWEVYDIKISGLDHISGKITQNPILRLVSSEKNNRISAWWGSWKILNREVPDRDLSKVKRFGIVDWMVKYAKI